MSLTPETAGRVCLVDDDEEFRQSAAWWLESLGYEVRTFAGPNACLDELAAEPEAADSACLLLDVRMPEMSGLQLLDALRDRGLDRPVIFMTGHGDVPLAVQAMRKGAVSFLEKPFQEAALEEALASALEAREAAAPAASTPQPVRNAAAMAEYGRRLSSLTPREREVMELVVGGDVNKVVAYKLGISPKTVELHRSRIMAKMQAATLTQLVRMSIHGEVEAGRPS